MPGRTKPGQSCGSYISPFEVPPSNVLGSLVMGAIWLPCSICGRLIMISGVTMSYQTDEPIKLTRDCQVVAVPAGHTLMLPQGTEVMITQSLGGSYTLLVPSYGGLFRLSNRDADAIGREPRMAEAGPGSGQALIGEALETEVWNSLKTCFDPEIPVNIVHL